MALYRYRPVANGLRTDHPIPDLAFVDDEHLPLEDPVAIEAIGRRKGPDMHGRQDSCKDGGWVAITTDPYRHDLAWVIRQHPEHGRSVVLYRDEDAAALHSVLVYGAPTALLFRAGGYWWDGTTWYRPHQLFDGAVEQYYRRPVPAAVTVTVPDQPQGGDPDGARVLTVTNVDADVDVRPGRWRDDLALWAAYRHGDVAGSVVSLAAPELTGDQLVGVTEMAGIAGIGASTLRAYLSRDEGDVPLPQATVSSRAMWARPVAEDWAELRRRSREGLIETVAADRDNATQPVGTTEVWKRFSRSFFSTLWERPAWRKRWALRWRTEAAVREIAETLSWDVAASMPQLIPIPHLATTVRHAVLHEFAYGQKERGDTDPSRHAWDSYAIGTSITTMLDWLIRHDPATAGRAIEQIIGEADRELSIPRQVSERSIRSALALDGTLDEQTRHAFLDRVLEPETRDA